MHAAVLHCALPNGTRLRYPRSDYMPRFHFNVLSREIFTQDDEGIDLPDLEAAEVEARVTVAEIAKERFAKGISHKVIVEVCDEDKNALFRATAEFRIEPAGSGRPPPSID